MPHPLAVKAIQGISVPRKTTDVADDSSPSLSRPESLQRLLFCEAEADETQIGFTTRLLVAALPHSQPSDNEFTRSSGFYDLCLLAPRRLGLPYGRYPRLACVWLITEAVRRRTPLLYLPRTFTQFAYQLGITPSSGPKGTLVQLREQLHRLVNVSISCLGTSPQDSSFDLSPRFYAGGGIHPINKYLLWWDDPPPSQDARSFIQLDTDFYNEVVSHPIPLSLRVIQSFRSPLEMDVYMWLTWRSVRSLRLQRPEPVSWQALEEQFGADYGEIRNFRLNFLRAIKRVLTIYPAVRVKSNRRGLILFPYPPHVPRRLPPKEL